MKGKQSKMKKSAITIIAVILAAVTAISGDILVLADFDEKSKGSFVLNDGENVIDSADFGTLKEQMRMLCDEVPNMSNISCDDMVRRKELKSKGSIQYDNGKVVIWTDDFVYLADEMDILETAYKRSIVNALELINTFFTTDGTIVHDRAGVSIEESARNISFDRLHEGIVKSQSVEHLSDEQIYAAAPANLSAGTAAWVDGELIIGSGADNDAFYKDGYEQGKKDMTLVTKAISIIYRHREENEGIGLISDVNGFSASASGTGNYTDNPANGHSQAITLIDFTEDEEAKLLYEIRVSGSSYTTGLQYGAGYTAGVSFTLRDGNGTLIDSKSFESVNDKEASYTLSFKLFDYNIETNQVYLEYRIYPRVWSSNCTDPNTGHEYYAETVTTSVGIDDYVSCIYYLPE